MPQCLTILLSFDSAESHYLSTSSATTTGHRMHLMKGTASKVIPIAVRRERIDLLVVGMAGKPSHSGIDKIARIDGSSTDKEKVFPDTVRKRGTYNE